MGQRDGQTIVIAGAVSEMGRHLSACLSDEGARIVALDRDHDGLIALAQHAPERIEPLALDILNPFLCERLAEIWDKEPVHLLVNLQALRHAGAKMRLISSIHGISTAMWRGLGGADGMIITVMSEPDDGDMIGKSISEALKTLHTTLAETGEVRMNSLIVGSDTAPKEVHGVVSFLMTADGRGINGAVIPLGR
jgi:hypothetical protein